MMAAGSNHTQQNQDQGPNQGHISGSLDARDVRMRGFLSRSSVDEAFAWLEKAVAPLATETISVVDAHRRVLSESVASPMNVPAFDRSAMDGYAVHGDETNGASDFNPLKFKIVGESMPGAPFDGSVARGCAVRIMTGAPMPTGANCVVPAEFTRSESNRDTVGVTKAFAPEKNVGRTGEDVRQGDDILAAGRQLRPQDVGLLASVGIDRVSVLQKPRVRILVTGNELVEIGESRNANQIFDSNTPMLCGLLERDAGDLESVTRCTDHRESIRYAMTSGDVDVVLVSGGSSVGTEDHAPGILAAAGELGIHGIAMRPSSPAGMGRITGSERSRLVFLLPGNPVSCLCAYDFFAARTIRRLGGLPGGWPYPRQRLPLARKISSAVGRVDYCRVLIRNGRVDPLALTGASRLSSTVRGDGFVVIPASLEGYAPETLVDVYCYDQQPSSWDGNPS
jgi:molybdopterin molybdotransferase